MDGKSGTPELRHCALAASAACFYFGAASRNGARCLGTRGRKRRLSSLELPPAKIFMAMQEAAFLDLFSVSLPFQAHKTALDAVALVDPALCFHC